MRWDGTGYPMGLVGADIPIAGRIVSVADVFDALTHEGPYKAAWSVEEALIEIGAQTGKQFDPMGGGSVPGVQPPRRPGCSRRRGRKGLGSPRPLGHGLALAVSRTFHTEPRSHRGCC